ncbi:hypothetical protein [Alkalibacillus salilacus]|uniref:CcmD family protein n=1 Tax=Alkalibacillus salilacus TaxID=284582 RepID=A0ABT9VIK1_9BACI|nr:hypothetical protein [Alkalibacillus salilacus]MDQ0160794.1 hypothetical protein [Alkalibacillus salilacus]
MEKVKKYCHLILALGVVLIVLGLFISQIPPSGGMVERERELMQYTVISWTLGSAGFSFVLLGGIFRLFIRDVDAELRGIKYKLFELEHKK